MIRQAIAADEQAIRDCAEQSYAKYVPRIGRKPAPMLSDFAAHIAEGEAFVAVDDEGGFQGFIVFFEEDGHMQLDSVGVIPTMAGRGIGKALIQFCENTARLRGFCAVHLYTNEKMTENLSIYLRLGYVEVARRTENGFNRVYFEKAVS